MLGSRAWPTCLKHMRWVDAGFLIKDGTRASIALNQEFKANGIQHAWDLSIRLRPELLGLLATENALSPEPAFRTPNSCRFLRCKPAGDDLSAPAAMELPTTVTKKPDTSCFFNVSCSLPECHGVVRCWSR